jgi:hypothetical protein
LHDFCRRILSFILCILLQCRWKWKSLPLTRAILNSGYIRTTMFINPQHRPVWTSTFYISCRGVFDLWSRVVRTQVYSLKLKLPTGLTCSQCVLQWKYNTGK